MQLERLADGDADGATPPVLPRMPRAHTILPPALQNRMAALCAAEPATSTGEGSDGARREAFDLCFAGNGSASSLHVHNAHRALQAAAAGGRLNASCMHARFLRAYAAEYAPLEEGTAAPERELADRDAVNKGGGAAAISAVELEHSGSSGRRQHGGARWDSGGAGIGHLAPFGEQGQPRVAIDVVQGCVDGEAFLGRYAFMHRPVLMRGCAQLTAPAAIGGWSDEHLRNVAGGQLGRGCEVRSLRGLAHADRLLIVP